MPDAMRYRNDGAYKVSMTVSMDRKLLCVNLDRKIRGSEPTPTPIASVPRPRFMAARRWASRHPCDCGGHFARETFFQASRMIQYTCNRCGQTILVPYEDAGVL